MKDICRFYLKATLLLSAIILLFFGIMVVLIKYNQRKPPVDSFYIKELEFASGDKLYSYKILDKKYKERDYNIAIIELDDVDFQKVLKGIQNHTHYKIVPSGKFNLYTIEMAMDKKVDGKIDIYERRRKNHIYKLGLNPPNKIIYESND